MNKIFTIFTIQFKQYVKHLLVFGLLVALCLYNVV